MMNVVLVRPSAAMLDADIVGDLGSLAALLEVEVDEWPPIGGEWDVAAIKHFRRSCAAPPCDSAWGAYYVTYEGHLVASAGFFGPPDPDGEVEIGYSVCAAYRRIGIATAIVARLTIEAGRGAATSLRARTTATNIASIRTLERNGFDVVDQAMPDDATHLLLRRQILAATA